MADELREKAIRGAKWRTLATYTAQGVQLVGAVVLAWLLDKDDYGLMAGAMVVISLIRGCTSLGMNYAIVQRRERVEEAVHTGFVLLMGLAAASYAVMLLVAPFTSAYEADAALVWALGLLFFIRPMGIVTEGAFYRDFRFRRLFVVEVSSVALSTGLGIGLAAALPPGERYWALAASGLAREALRSGVGWALAPIRPRLRFDRDVARELLHYGKYLWAGAVVMVLYNNLERLALMELLTVGALGLYHFAYAWVLRVGMISETIFGGVAISVYARVQDDVARLREGFCRIVGYSTLLSTGLLTGLVVLVPEAVALAFPPRWMATVPVFRVLGFYYMVRAVDTTTGQLYASVGKTKYNLYLGLVNTAAMAATVVPFVLWWGVVGAAWCVLAARVVTLACNAFVVRRVLACPLGRLARIVMPAAKAALAMAAVLVAALLGVLHLWGHVGWLALGGLVVLGGASYAAVLYIAERQLFLELLGLLRDALRGKKVKADGLAS
ncbi:MAG: lipopolysaccharide biosynthesis protein [Candidatus Brocadiia bacterium]